jgi:hypothetical protein
MAISGAYLGLAGHAAMDSDSRKFCGETARSLEGALQRLMAEEARLIETLGPVRVEEITEYCNGTLDSKETETFRRGLDFTDRELISVWNRLIRVRHDRAAVGHTIMRNGLSLAEDDNRPD